MYQYKFAGGTQPVDIQISNRVIDGYISFGDGSAVDWTVKHYVDGALQDIPKPPEPEPYVPTEAELLAQAKQEKLWQIEAKLAVLDRYLPRALEDFWTAESYNTKKLPQVQQDRLAERVALREKYNAVEAAATVAEVEAIILE